MWNLRREPTVALATLALTACTSFPDRVRNASSGHCVDVLTAHGELAADPRYAELSPGGRENHEEKVALCYLELQRPEKAVAIARTWSADEAFVKDEVEARAAAQLGQAAECRAAMERIGARRVTDLDFFLEVPEFRQFAGEDWFLRMAAHVWGRSRARSAEEFARALARRSGAGLLPLRVASADRQRSPGELGLWLGVVAKSRIDREKRRTELMAEGLEWRHRTVTTVADFESTARSVNPSHGELRAEEDELVPNGLHFLVQYDGVDERLVGMQNIVVFGRFAGWGTDDLPVLNAYFVGPPEESRSSDAR